MAATSAEAPAGWTTTGSVVVDVVNGDATAITVNDAAGKVAATERVAPGKKQMQETIRRAVCKAGGTVGVHQAGEPASANVSVTILVYHPAREDEPGDVALMCQPGGDGGDAALKMRLLAELFEERLTSTRWRTWMYAMSDELRAKNAGPLEPAVTDLVAIKRKYAPELLTAAKGRCWFAEQLAR